MKPQFALFLLVALFLAAGVACRASDSPAATRPGDVEAELRFDGTGYPENPTVPPAGRATDTVGAETLIPDFESFTDGKLLIAP